LNLIVPLLVLFACQLMGEVLQAVFGLPVPGPVLGMVILLVGLGVHRGIPEPLANIANGILSHLSLLFVPAGVGVLLHFSRIQAEWPAIVVALLVSTWLTLIVTAGTMRLASRAMGLDDPCAEQDS
jgi:holin-like protein